MNEELSILILSCDKNEGVLNIFFAFFEQYWPNCSYKVYLGLEEKKLEYDHVITLNSECKKWSGRVQEYLSVIKTKYLLLVLDDFIVEKPVDDMEIERYLSIIKTDDKIAVISLADIYDDRNQSTRFKYLKKRKYNGDFLLNLQAGIWNKDILNNLLKSNESPWQVELYGSVRARKLKDLLFLCLDTDEHMPYIYNRGWLIVRGCWNGNEIKRLGLQDYGKDIFDGKDIIYDDFMKISFLRRLQRRLAITYRQILSCIGIYI